MKYIKLNTSKKENKTKSQVIHKVDTTKAKEMIANYYKNQEKR